MESLCSIASKQMHFFSSLRKFHCFGAWHHKNEGNCVYKSPFYYFNGQVSLTNQAPFLLKVFIYHVEIFAGFGVLLFMPLVETHLLFPELASLFA